MNNNICYEFANGNKVTIRDFAKPISECFLMINLPNTLANYEAGRGESIWAYTDEESYKKWLKGEKDSIIYVKVLNDSIYYKELQYEDLMPVELRGASKPVAIYEELIAKYSVVNNN